jgi:hypothetical protein
MDLLNETSVSMQEMKRQPIKRFTVFSWLFLFLLLALIPHAWMLSGKGNASDSSIRFKMRDNFSEYEIETNRPTQNVVSILGTTNLLDLKLTTPNRKPFRLFFAQWEADDNNTMMVLRHTPDICWMNAGWTFIEVGLPKIVYLDIPIDKKEPSFNRNEKNGTTFKIPFECRTYRSPDRRYTEAVIWCSMLGGYLLNSYGLELQKNSNSESLFEQNINPSSTSQIRNNHLMYILRNRIQKYSDKQYVRLSMEYDKNNTNIIQELGKLVGKHFSVY